MIVRLLSFCAVPLVAASLSLPIAASSAQAKAVVQGDADAVVIELEDSSIDEVLTALGASFNVHYESSAKLEKRLSGRYQGSLQRVVRRVLEGYDFIARNRGDGLEITILNRGPATTTRVASAPAAPAQSNDQANSQPRVVEQPAMASKVSVETSGKNPAPRADAPIQVAELTPTPNGNALPMPELQVAQGQPMPMPTFTGDSEMKSGPVPTQNGGSGPVPIPSAEGTGPTPTPSSATPDLITPGTPTIAGSPPAPAMTPAPATTVAPAPAK